MPYPEAPRMPDHTSQVRPLHQVKLLTAPHRIEQAVSAGDFTGEASFTFVARTDEEYSQQKAMLRAAAPQSDLPSSTIERVLNKLVLQRQEEQRQATKSADVALIERVLSGLRRLDVSGPSAMDLARGTAVAEEPAAPPPAHVTLLDRVVHGVGQPVASVEEPPKQVVKPSYLPVLFSTREELVDTVMTKRAKRLGASEEIIRSRADFSSIKHAEGANPLAQHEHYQPVLNQAPETTSFLGEADWRFRLTAQARERLYARPETSDFFKDLPYYNPVRHDLKAPLTKTDSDPLTGPKPHKSYNGPTLYDEIVIGRGRDPITGEEKIDPLTTSFDTVQQAYEASPRYTYPEASAETDDAKSAEPLADAEVSASALASEMVVRPLGLPAVKGPEKEDVVDMTRVRAAELAIEQRRVPLAQVGSLALDSEGRRDSSFSTVSDEDGTGTRVLNGRIFAKSDGLTAVSGPDLRIVAPKKIPDMTRARNQATSGTYHVSGWNVGGRGVWVSPLHHPKALHSATAAEAATETVTIAEDALVPLTASERPAVPALESADSSRSSEVAVPAAKRSLAAFVVQAFKHRHSSDTRQAKSDHHERKEKSPRVAGAVLAGLGALGARAALRAWNDRRKR